MSVHRAKSQHQDEPVNTRPCPNSQEDDELVPHTTNARPRVPDDSPTREKGKS